jgi:hypothetical protein
MNTDLQTKNSSENILKAAIPHLPHRWDHKLAKFISNLLSPPGVITIAMLIMSANLALWDWGLFYIFTVIGIPTLYVFWLLRTGRIADFHMYSREERIKPMVLVVIACIIAWLILIAFNVRYELRLFAGIGILLTSLLTLITKFWKISIHATSVSGLSTFLVVLFGWSYGLVLLSIPLVTWARMRTKNHSFKQLMAGTFVGAAFILVLLKIIAANCQGATLVCG